MRIVFNLFIIMSLCFLFHTNIFAFDYASFTYDKKSEVNKIESMINQRSTVLKRLNKKISYLQNELNSRNERFTKKELVDNPQKDKQQKIIDERINNCKKNTKEMTPLNYKINTLTKKILKTFKTVMNDSKSKKQYMDESEIVNYRNIVINPLKKVMKKYNEQKKFESKISKNADDIQEHFLCNEQKMCQFSQKILDYNQRKANQMGYNYQRYRPGLNIFYDTQKCTVLGFYSKDYSKTYERKRELENYRKKIDRNKSYARDCLRKTGYKKSKIKIEEFSKISF